MNGPSTRTLLLVLIVTVPLVVAGAVLVSFLLLRAGHGLVVSALLPLLGTMAVVVTLGVFLGRAANRSRGGGEGQNRKRDGV
ncbi:MAG: hypothetical protein M3397_03760 [Actinomycetota bacterium]|jgi:CHASE2 domain-containing sensor protein|nr:hypothetical protein [Actinomycetota bacterium]